MHDRPGVAKKTTVCENITFILLLNIIIWVGTVSDQVVFSVSDSLAWVTVCEFPRSVPGFLPPPKNTPVVGVST